MIGKRIVSAVVITSILCLLTLTPICAANEGANDLLQGKMEGEQAASGSAIWFVGGFCCGLVGVGAAYVFPPDPPAEALLGKSPEYIMGYKEGYQNKARRKNLMYAGVGYATACCIGIIWYAVAISAAANAADDEVYYYY